MAAPELAPAAMMVASAEVAHHEIVRLENVHVRYRVYEQRHTTLRDITIRGLKPRRYSEIHALKDISFSVRSGESVGLIGSNGAGKSTLMKTIAGLLPVTEGAVYAAGEPALLGVGSALRPRLSGRENITIGALALGMSSDEIAEMERETIAWAQLGDFIDLPMRTYSSGMRARLAFAIATSARPDILLVDEALSVGDRRFRRRSRRRIKQLRDNAGAVFLAAHGMGQIRQMCDRAIWLDDGRLVMDGTPDDVIAEYEAFQDRDAEPDDEPSDDD